MNAMALLWSRRGKASDGFGRIMEIQQLSYMNGYRFSAAVTIWSKAEEFMYKAKLSKY
jgi:hypothetical protein